MLEGRDEVYSPNKWTYSDDAAADRLALFSSGMSSVAISGTVLPARFPTMAVVPRFGLLGTRPPRLP